MAKAESQHFDERLSTEVSARLLDRVPAGTPRTVVERRFGEASETEPDGVAETRRSDCRYYLELGGTAYLRVCYRHDRFVGWQRTDPERDDFFFAY